MRITKAGVLPGEKYYQGRCPNCGCEFTFQRKEAVKEECDRNDLYMVVTCPETNCPKQMWIRV